MSIQWRYVLLSFAIVVSSIGFLVWANSVQRDFSYRPPHLSYVLFSDPLPLARVGSSARAAIPDLIRGLNTHSHDMPHADIALTLGIIGTSEAEAALTKRLDEIERTTPGPDKFRAHSTMPLLYGLALVNSPSSRQRILQFYPEATDFETSFLEFLMEEVPLNVDEPGFVVSTLKAAPSAKAFKAVILNLNHYFHIHSYQRSFLPDSLASDRELARIVTGHETLFSGNEDFRDWRENLLMFLNCMTAREARRFVDNATPGNQGRPHPLASQKPYESGDAALAYYLACAPQDRFRFTEGFTDTTDFSQSDTLVTRLNQRKPGRLLDEVMKSRLAMDAIGFRIVPALINRLDECSEPVAMGGNGNESRIRIDALKAFVALKRATGKNFGLNADSWWFWWYLNTPQRLENSTHPNTHQSIHR